MMGQRLGGRFPASFELTGCLGEWVIIGKELRLGMIGV